MFKDFSGKEWQREDDYILYKTYRKRYLNLSLAVENYIDYTGKNEIFKTEAFTKLKELRTNQSNYTTTELLSQSLEIVKLFEALVKEIGFDFFTQCNDGTIIFNWPKKDKGV